MYSDMIEHAAAVLSAENGWTLSKASEYIEDLIFNSNADIPGLLASITDGTFEINPPVRIRKGRKKGERRDLWKAPFRVQEARILGITMDELEMIRDMRRDLFHRKYSGTEHMKAVNILDRYFRTADTEQSRRWCRLNEFGIWAAGTKDLHYGFITKQARREKYWKRALERYLSSENIRALKIH